MKRADDARAQYALAIERDPRGVGFVIRAWAILLMIRAIPNWHSSITEKPRN
jgi:hypothetical protein